MKYRIVFIDADDTLFDYDKAEAYALEKTMKTFSFPCDFDAYLIEYRKINKKLWTELEEEITTKEKLRIERFNKLFCNDRITFDIASFSKEYLCNLSAGSQLIEGAREICEYLKSKYTVVVITNGIMEVQVPRIEKSPIKSYIDHVVVSEKAGFQKPNARIFDYAFKLAGHQDRESAIMIGDSLESDILGGSSYGIDTCWYNSRREANSTGIIPTYEIQHLDELRMIL